MGKLASSLPFSEDGPPDSAKGMQIPPKQATLEVKRRLALWEKDDISQLWLEASVNVSTRKRPSTRAASKEEADGLSRQQVSVIKSLVEDGAVSKAC